MTRGGLGDYISINAKSKQGDALKSLIGDKSDSYDLDSLMYVMLDNKTPTYVRSLPQEVMDLRSQEYEKYFLSSQSLDQTVQAMVARHNEYLKQKK